MQSITISGDLGSGKTTISEMLAQRMGIRRIGAGDIYRRMAAERGMTAMQLNLHSILDDAVDSYIDQLQRSLAASGEQVVLDSRLGWHFVASAFKVHLTVDPRVAAARAFARPATATESYKSVEDAQQRLRERSDSERYRFLEKYGADKGRMRNYDLICDTTRMSPMEAADRIISVFNSTSGREGDVVALPKPVLLLAPQRLYPSHSITGLRELRDADYVKTTASLGPAGLEPLAIGYADECFYVIDGHWRLSAALQNNFQYVPGYLVAEQSEEVVEGTNASEYFRSETKLSTIFDWEAAHAVELELPPHLRGSDLPMKP